MGRSCWPARTVAGAALLVALHGCATAPPRQAAAPAQTATLRTVQVPAAPARGPYAPAVIAGEFVYVSGQLPWDAAAGAMVEGDIGRQTARVLANVAALLEAAGSGRERVVKATVYLAEPADFAGMNAVYAAFFAEHLPARTTVPGIALPPGVRVEIDVVALRQP